MIYFDLNTRLHPTQVEQLLQMEHDFWDHQTYGDDTNLDIALLPKCSLNGEIRSMFMASPSAVTVMRIEAGQEVVPHVDDPEHRRPSSVVFPLWPGGDKYAPCTIYMDEGTYDIGWRSCYAFNTQIKHGVKNDTEYDRLNLQVWFNMPIADLYDLYQKGELVHPSALSNPTG